MDVRRLAPAGVSGIFLAITVDVPRKRYNAGLCRDVNVSSCYAWFPIQFCEEGLLQFSIA